MRIKLILHFLGTLAIILGISLLPSIIVSVVKDSDYTASLLPPLWSFIITAILSISAGIYLRLRFKPSGNENLSATDGFAATTAGWLLAGLIGALPYYLVLCGQGDFSFIDAFFESISGFTTTGSSVFGTSVLDGGYGTIEGLPKSILFWRALTHWLGGMGIVVLALAVLPTLRAGGYQLFMAEVPGPSADRLQPRIRETAAILWGAYSVLTLLETMLLFVGGMPLFDALCHTFATMATGGFSTKDASIAYYANMPGFQGIYFELVIDLFMFLAGCNFLLHFQALRGKPREYLKNVEFRFYGLVTICVTLLLTLIVFIGNNYSGIFESLRQSLFQTLSIMTTTGFATTDTNMWPIPAKAVLLLIMFFGGCAGSTGGGMKQIRIMVAWKYAIRELKKLLRPNMVNRLRIGENITLEEHAAMGIIGLLLLWTGVFALASVAICFLLPHNASADFEIVTGVSAVAACLNNIGPGFAAVGSSANFSALSGSIKLLLSGCMLLGRLEIYSVLVLLLPIAWRK